MSYYLERAKQGAALLDEVADPDWREQLDLATLNMQNCEECVLGQLYGDYGEGLAVVELSEYDAAEFGFTTNGSWTWLNKAWRKLLA
jgi:hypothetical protein